MVIKIEEIKLEFKDKLYSIENHDGLMILNKNDFLDLYRQMTKMMVDEVVANYDPDKPRKGFGSDEPHKKKKEDD